MRRDLSRSERRQLSRDERDELFRKKRRFSLPAPWRHKFMCLSMRDADRVPTSQSDKMALEEAGLGEKTITIPDLDCEPLEFHEVILTAYPKLKDGGGFELLRCARDSRNLVLIGPRVSASPKLLKRRVGNGRVYVRPVQRDLSMDADDVEDEEVKGVSSSSPRGWYCW